MIKLGQHTLIFFSALLFTACSGGGSTGTTATPLLPCAAPTTATLPVVTISSPISTATTWASGSVYYISQSITVTAPLTIKPGAVVKFATTTTGGTNLTVGSGGSITANGNSTGSIVFTSYKDDSVGGDSNAATGTPAMGDWGKIILNSNGSSFSCANFNYGGNTDSTLQINGNMVNSASIIYSTFAHNNGANSSGLLATGLDAVGALDASFAITGTVIIGNTFYDNKVPLSISGAFSVNDSNVFHNPADATVVNKYNGIFLVGGPFKNITGSISFLETEVPYVFGGKIDIPNNSALTLGDNVVIKFFDSASALNTNYNNVLNASAKIIANATGINKIVFTSFKDDSKGGDTNGDAAASTPAAGDWARIALNADNSIFNQCKFFYGGADNTNRETLNLNAIKATITNSLFVNNHGGTIDSESGVINASNAKINTVITGNTFYNNHVPLTISGNFSIDNSNIFHDPANTLTTNTYNGIFFPLDTVKSIYTISLLETEVPFVLKGDLTVKTGSVLTVGDAVVLKFSGATTQLTFESGLTQYVSGAGIIYTSIKDDVRLGDTNGDLATTSPATGDWKGIRVAAGGGTFITLHPDRTYYCNSCNP